MGCLLLISFSARSQYFNQNNIPYISPMPDSSVRKAGISEITEVYVYINKKGKTNTSKEIFQYDRQGKATFNCTFEDSLLMKNITVSTAVNHTTSGAAGTSKTWRYGKEQKTSVVMFNASEQVSQYYIYNNRGRLIRSQEVFYKDSMRSRINTYNRKHQLKNYYLYEYSGKKLKTSGLYNSNGKVIRFWNYNCDDAGSMQKQKDTTTICTAKTYLNDGSTISTVNYFNEKGEPVKSVIYSDSNGRQTKYLYYLGKEQTLIYQTASTYINNQEASYYSKSYTRNNKAFSSTYKIYDAEHKVISHLDSGWYTKKPYHTKNEYTYDSKGLLTERKNYYRGRLSGIYTYRYRYYLRKE
jgi:hypothetical protein